MTYRPIEERLLELLHEEQEIEPGRLLSYTIVTTDDGKTRQVDIQHIHPVEVFNAFIQMRWKPIHGTFLMPDETHAHALTALLLYHQHRESPARMVKAKADTMIRKDVEYYLIRPLCRLYHCTVDYLYGYDHGWSGLALPKGFGRRTATPEQVEFRTGHQDGFAAYRLVQPVAVTI